MNITVDANILFAALIREGMTRNLWFAPDVVMFAPDFILTEFDKYRRELKKKFGGTVEEFDLLCEKILSQVKFVSEQELIPFLPAAASLTNDAKDWLYFACALKENTAIWSNDKEMKKQTRISVKTTIELIEEVGTL